jgi:hypothetical protein
MRLYDRPFDTAPNEPASKDEVLSSTFTGSKISGAVCVGDVYHFDLSGWTVAPHVHATLLGVSQSLHVVDDLHSLHGTFTAEQDSNARAKINDMTNGNAQNPAVVECNGAVPVGAHRCCPHGRSGKAP